MRDSRYYDIYDLFCYYSEKQAGIIKTKEKVEDQIYKWEKEREIIEIKEKEQRKLASKEDVKIKGWYGKNFYRPCGKCKGLKNLIEITEKNKYRAICYKCEETTRNFCKLSGIEFDEKALDIRNWEKDEHGRDVYNGNK